MRSLFTSLIVLMMLIFVPAVSYATGMTPLKQMPEGEYVLDETHSSLVVKIDHIGLSKYTMRFTDFEAKLLLNPTEPEKSTITASVNPLSIKTEYPHSGEKDFDKKLSEGEEWLNGLKFPHITFTATKLGGIEGNKGVMTGDLTMLGETNPVTFNVTLNGAYENKPFANVAALGVSANAVIQRSQWGFSTYVPQIGDEVEIILELEFHKKGAAE